MSKYLIFLRLQWYLNEVLHFVHLFFEMWVVIVFGIMYNKIQKTFKSS